MGKKKTEQRRTYRPEGIESLYLHGKASRNGEKGETEYFPCVYIEADIDFNDVRTGYKSDVKLARALKIYENQEVSGWSEEFVHDENIDTIKAFPPRAARFCPAPEFMNAEFIDSVKKLFLEYLTRTWKTILYHNSELNIYSGAGESRNEFFVRCREQFLCQMREELNQLRVLFNRMQEQLKEKYLGIGEEAELPEQASPVPKTSDRNIYSRYTERIAALFLNALPVADAEAAAARMDKKSELEERLIALMAEARLKIALLREKYEKKAEFIDEYILRSNLNNIRCKRCCILWMPRKAE